MRTFISRLGVTAVIGATTAIAAARAAAADPPSARDRFRRPPDDARPMVRWWWFGPAVTEAEVRREIAAMKAGGFGGFELQNTYPLATGKEPPGVANLRFLSPAHLKMIGVAAGAARAAGLRMDLTLGSGWPYGGATTPIGTAAGRLRVERGRAPTLHDGESLIATVTTQGGPTSFVAGRTRMMVKRPASGAEGFVVDHLDAGAVRHFLDTVAEPMLGACGPDVPHAVFCDSLESYGEDWTTGLPEAFARRRGYDLRPLLPALTGDGVPDAAEVRHDWGRTLTELFDANFMSPLADFAHARRTLVRIQAYGIPSASASSYLAADLPEGEGFQWHGYRATRFASSAAHLMGVPVSSSETFTWLHPPVFRATPLDVKAEANQHFLQGVNQIICHGWPYSPPEAGEPGWSFYAAGVFNDHNPWWPVMPDVTEYLARCSDLLRQGRPADDVLVYLANDDAWSDFRPGHVSLTDGVGERMGPAVVGAVLDAGYGLDFFDDGLLAARGTVDGGSLAFGDLRYKVVVLAGVERLPPATLRTLEAFVHGGGTLIATRSVPSRAPGYKASTEDKQAVADITGRLFGGDHPPAVFVKDEKDLPAALAAHLRPDVRLEPATPAVGFVHRHTPAGDVYFVANTLNQTVTTMAWFREARQRAEQWDLTTGETRVLPVVGSAVPVSLPAYDATAIFFPADAAPVADSKVTVKDVDIGGLAETDLSDGWSVQFPGGPPTPIAHLHSWADDPATRGFSGTATYTRRLMVAAEMAHARRLTLGFGTGTPVPHQANGRSGSGFTAELVPPIGEAAVVYVNGKRAGAVWCPPYTIDIAPRVHAGENDLRVEVFNTAVNALSGGRFPNYDVAGLRAAFGRRFDPARAAAFEPVPSGLLGPITLTAEPP